MRPSLTIHRSLVLLLLFCCGFILQPGLRAQEAVDTAFVDSVAEAAMPVADSLVMALPDSALVDSAALTAITDSLIHLPVKKKRDLTTFKPEPMRAMWLALVIPGGGQIYNRKYWKLPIIYGGFLGCVYALSWNSLMLKDYSQAYLDIMDSDPETKSYMKMLPMGYNMEGKEDRFKEIFKNKKNYFRKYRDMSIFAFGAVYLLSVVDAYVDAELSGFDISRDLSLHFQPTLLETERMGMHHRSTTPGIQCVLTY